MGTGPEFLLELGADRVTQIRSTLSPIRGVVALVNPWPHDNGSPRSAPCPAAIPPFALDVYRLTAPGIPRHSADDYFQYLDRLVTGDANQTMVVLADEGKVPAYWEQLRRMAPAKTWLFVALDPHQAVPINDPTFELSAKTLANFGVQAVCVSGTYFRTTELEVERPCLGTAGTVAAGLLSRTELRAVVVGKTVLVEGWED